MSEQLEQFRMLIGGKAVDAISGRTFESENPYTGRPWAVIPDAGPEDVDAAVQAARAVAHALETMQFDPAVTGTCR